MPNIAHEPTEESRARVKALAGYGIPQEGIGSIIGISDDTLRKYYRAELDNAAHEVNAQVAQYAFGRIRAGQAENASEDARAAADDMARFWLRYHPSSAWRRENIDVNVRGELKHEHAVAVETVPAATIDLTALSDDDLARHFRARVAGTLPAPANDRGAAPAPAPAALPAPREPSTAA